MTTHDPARPAEPATDTSPCQESTWQDATWQDTSWDDGDQPTGTRVLGVPVSLSLRGLRERTARSFSPNDPLLVPKAWGVGWDVNLGALAVRTGMAHRDDLGEDLTLGPAGATALSVAPAALALGAGLGGLAASPTAQARDVAAALAPAAVISTALGAVDLARRSLLTHRLGHAALSLLVTGAGVAAALQARGAGAPLQAAAAATSVAAATGVGALTLRAAIHRTMSQTAASSTQEPS